MRRGVPQHGERGAHAETGVLAAANQLEHLRAKFDFADAAASELDVVGLVGTHRRTALRLLANLQMQRADCADHAEVEITAVDERRDDRIELFRQALRRVARPFGHEPAFDPRITLPLAALHVEIFLEHAEAAHERSRIAVRTQTHVDAKHVAVGGHFGERADQALAEARKKVLRGNRRALAARRLAVLFVDEDQVDVRRDVQLAAAELAHADDAEREPFALRAARLAEERFEFGGQHRERALDRGLGEIRHRAGDFGDVRLAGQVALHHRAEDLRAQLAQRALQCGLRQRRVGAAGRFGAQRVEAGVDALARQRPGRKLRHLRDELRTGRHGARRVM
ncbi:hypothetical protein ABIE53_000854 [Burkholderia sp. OAS925]